MFSIRQVLSFVAQRACNRYALCHRYVPFIKYKPNDCMITLRHDRLLHESSKNNKELGKLEGKMKLIFTCKKCQTRNSKLMSKLAYNKGVVIVRCDGCKNNHLIADNLGWFSDMHKGTNIEKIMASKGETVRKIINDVDGYYEALTNEEYRLHKQNVNKTNELDNNNKCFDKIKELELSNKS